MSPKREVKQRKRWRPLSAISNIARQTMLLRKARKEGKQAIKIVMERFAQNPRVFQEGGRIVTRRIKLSLKPKVIVSEERAKKYLGALRVLKETLEKCSNYIEQGKTLEWEFVQQ